MFEPSCPDDHYESFFNNYVPSNPTKLKSSHVKTNRNFTSALKLEKENESMFQMDSEVKEDEEGEGDFLSKDGGTVMSVSLLKKRKNGRIGRFVKLFSRDSHKAKKNYDVKSEADKKKDSLNAKKKNKKRFLYPRQKEKSTDPEYMIGDPEINKTLPDPLTLYKPLPDDHVDEVLKMNNSFDDFHIEKNDFILKEFSDSHYCGDSSLQFEIGDKLTNSIMPTNSVNKNILSNSTQPKYSPNGKNIDEKIEITSNKRWDHQSASLIPTREANGSTEMEQHPRAISNYSAIEAMSHKLPKDLPQNDIPQIYDDIPFDEV
eukprot:CAMPEP_0184861750 /NCGR_PEP_ID=MMETSP0580-20130426/6360_1 /TAXON_ID=1118495 /ORGANISM="Dactyliosolen fragilissimus" /LENGTH=316 /DNA_ID=CAMNT_0027359347 /DNA_START=637 /DNA_END=1587 /DNA_ORIENTATION=+